MADPSENAAGAPAPAQGEAEAEAGRRGSAGGYWGMLSAYGRKASAATKTAATQLQKNLPPAEVVKKSLVDGTSSAVNYVGKTADDLRKLDKEKLKEDAYTGWSLGSHRVKELLGREKDVTEGPDELADLTRTGRDWATLLANASKCKDAHEKLCKSEGDFGTHLDAIGAMHQEEADNTTDEDVKRSEQVMADLLTGFGAASKQLEEQRSGVAGVVQSHLVEPAKVFKDHVAKDARDTAAKFHRKRLEYDVHRAKVRNLKKKIEDDQAKVAQGGAGDPAVLQEKLQTTESELEKLEKTFEAQKVQLLTKITMLQDKSRRDLISHISAYTMALEQHHLQCLQIVQELKPLCAAAAETTEETSQRMIAKVAETSAMSPPTSPHSALASPTVPPAADATPVDVAVDSTDEDAGLQEPAEPPVPPVAVAEAVSVADDDAAKQKEGDEGEAEGEAVAASEAGSTK